MENTKKTKDKQYFIDKIINGEFKIKKFMNTYSNDTFVFIKVDDKHCFSFIIIDNFCYQYVPDKSEEMKLDLNHQQQEKITMILERIEEKIINNNK